MSTAKMKLAQYAEIWPRYGAIDNPFPLIFTAVLALIYYSLQAPRSNVPLANPKGGMQLSKQAAKQKFVSQANKLIGEWFKTHPNKPIRLIGDVEDITVLPPSLAQEIRNDKRLSFDQWTFKVRRSSCPLFKQDLTFYRHSMAIYLVSKPLAQVQMART